MTRDGRKRWQFALAGIVVAASTIALGAWLRPDRGTWRGDERILGVDAQGRLWETSRPIPFARAVKVTRLLSGGKTRSITVGLDFGMGGR